MSQEMNRDLNGELPREEKMEERPGPRQRLADLQGRRYWRSLEELADTDEFREYLGREFPEQASEWTDPVSRRSFMRVMGASMALAGLGTACTRQPRETIVPFNRAPEDMVPGTPLFYATAMPLAGYGIGVLAESHMGRPTKIEGNPDHPASLGASSVLAQGSVLGLYDPDRSQTVTHLGDIRPWGDFVTSMNGVLEGARASGGAGVRILTGRVTSPTLAAQMEALLAEWPGAAWVVHEPAASGNAMKGAALAFGRPLSTHHRLERAERIVSLDADFLGAGPDTIRCIRDYARGRKLSGDREMNRLYVMEATPTLTGAMADHRLAVRSSEISGLARRLAAALGVSGVSGEHGPHHEWIAAVARDLQAHRGAGAVIAGEGQPAEVHALAHLMNHALGNTGTTVIHTEPVEVTPPGSRGLEELAGEMDRGEVSLLVMMGSNPVYSAPADLEFATKMERVGLRIHVGSHADETSLHSHWHIPMAHYLEAWSDLRSVDGTASIVQPLIEPLYGGKSAHEILAVLQGKASRSGYDEVRDTWRDLMGDGFDRSWGRALHDGLVAGSAFPPVMPEPDSSWSPGPAPASGGEGLELVFREDASAFDGSFANNGWLQELPRPISKLTWENAVMVSPATAAAMSLESGDQVELTAGDGSVTGPAWIAPGHADGSLTVHLGYGRTRAGRVGNGAGFSAYALRSSATPWIATGVRLTKTGETHPLATTQMHQNMEGRHLVRSGTLEHYREEPGFAGHMGHEPAEDMTLYPPHPYESYAWGMSVDLNACVGCNACVAGCVSENNIPVVGKTEVINGRAMHWLRIDRYFEGSPESPQVHHQPVMCQHCENAPCEVVCPVAATVHSSEGLNDMIYNRCVGTRYCANNCPYKVRRFNFFYYQDESPSLALQRNPDVTVRSRGVMEKCSYCVQRINLARIEAKKEDRKIRDGEVTTACQQACPAGAIVFGDINDPQSRVSKAKADPRSYGILTDLNTKPRTTYLASIRNPNPELAGEAQSAAGGGAHHG